MPLPLDTHVYFRYNFKSKATHHGIVVAVDDASEEYTIKMRNGKIMNHIKRRHIRVRDPGHSDKESEEEDGVVDVGAARRRTSSGESISPSARARTVSGER